MSSASGFTFTAVGSGTNLIRMTTVAGRPLQIKTGHSYFRPHLTAAGIVRDLRSSGLTLDQVETAIAWDLETKLTAGVVLPAPGPGFTGPLFGSVVLAGITIEYRVVELAGGTIHVGTYYQT
jgi:hypothetical protein